MSLHREQIHTLLAEIDGVLNKASPRLPWLMSNEVNQQRQTLEKVRRSLVALQQDIGQPGGYFFGGDAAPLTHLEISSPVTAELIESATTPQMALNLSQQVIQQFAQDLGQLRSSLLQPLHTEVGRLQQQRDTLLQEIRQLERQRQQHSVVQQRASQEQLMHDFLQGLMERLQERLSQQINQIIQNAAASQSFSTPAFGDGGQALAPLFPQEGSLPPLPPAQRMEQAQMLQSRADQVMVTLDTTLRVFAEALQQNIQSYESSLAQGLEKMHSMGQQGEAIVSGLVQKLAEQVSGQVSLGDSEIPNRGLGGLSPAARFSSGVSPLPSLPTKPLPYPGSEVSDRRVDQSGDRLGNRPGNLSRPGLSPTPSLSSSTVPSEIRPPSPAIVPPSISGIDLAGTDLGDADLENLDWDAAEADLELDLEVLGHLENSPIENSPIAGEPGVRNEELDSFYASLFGGDETAPVGAGLKPASTDELDGETQDAETPELEVENPASDQDFFAAFTDEIDPLNSPEAPAPEILAAVDLGLDLEPLENDRSSVTSSLAFPVKADLPGDLALAELEQALQAVVSPSNLSPSNTPNNDRPVTPDSLDRPSETIPGSRLALIPQPPKNDRTGLSALDEIPPEDKIMALTDLRISSSTPPPANFANPTPSFTPSNGQVFPIPDTNAPGSNTPINEEEVYPPALPEESLLVKEDGEEAAKTELSLEPETLQQLQEDLFNLERQEQLGMAESSELPLRDVFGDVFGLEADPFGAFKDESLAEDLFHLSDEPLSDKDLSEVFNTVLPGEGLEIDLLEDEPDDSPPIASGSSLAVDTDAIPWDDGFAPPTESLLPETEPEDLSWFTNPAPAETIVPTLEPNEDRDEFSIERIAAFFTDADRLEVQPPGETTSPDLGLNDLSDWFPDLSPQEASQESTGTTGATTLPKVADLFEDLPDADFSEEEKKNHSY